MAVEEIMTEALQTVTPDTRLRRCAEILRAGRFRHLPVVVDGRAVGIVSARDFFDHVAERLEEVVDQEKYKKDLGDGVDPYDHAGGSYGH
jgi:CBS domain-containing protein